MRKILDKIVERLSAIPVDKWMHLSAGFVMGAFMAIGFPSIRWGAIIAAAAAGLAKELFDLVTTRRFDWLDLAATALGGAAIQAFVLMLT